MCAVFAAFLWEDKLLMTLDHATLIFLVFVFVAAEVYRIRRGQAAVIVSVGDNSFGPVQLPVMQIGGTAGNGC